MKKTRKSLLSVLLTLVMLVGLVPALATEAHAAALPNDVTLTIDGTQITDTDDDLPYGVYVSYSGTTITLELCDYYGYDNAIILTGNTAYNLAIKLDGENWIEASNGPAISNATGGNISFELKEVGGWGDLGLESTTNAVHVTGSGIVTLGSGLVAGKASSDIYATFNVLYEAVSGAEKIVGDGSTDVKDKLSDRYAYITVGNDEMSEPVIEESAQDALPENVSDFKFSDYDNYTIAERSGIDKLSFNVGLKNSDSYEGSRPSSSYRYLISRETSTSPAPVVTFSNNASEYTLSFNENMGGTDELKTVMLNIDTSNDPAHGLHVYRITQRYTVDQHNAGFDAKDDALNGSYWDTDYYLVLSVNGGGHVTQAILLPGDATSEGDKRDGFYIEYTSSVQLRTVTLAKESQSIAAGTDFKFDVEFELPAGINSAKIEIEGYSGTITFDTHRKATAEDVTVKVGQTIDMSGIPEGTIVRVKETDSSGRYVATSAVTGMANSNNLTSGEELANGYTTYGTVNGTGGKIVYTNEYREISLTGVTLRYAPYMAMMGAGLAVVGLSKTRRKEEEI